MMDIKNVQDNLRKKNAAPNGKKVVIDWTSEVIEAFEQLIEVMCSELVLVLPDFKLDF